MKPEISPHAPSNRDPHVLLGRIVDAATDLAHLVTARSDMGTPPPGSVRDILRRWLDVYGGSTSANPDEQADMDKLESDTNLWLAWGPYPVEQSEVLAEHEGEKPRREWHSVGAWLYMGDRIIVQRAAAASEPCSEGKVALVIDQSVHTAALPTPRTDALHLRQVDAWNTHPSPDTEFALDQCTEMRMLACTLEREAAALRRELAEQEGYPGIAHDFEKCKAERDALQRRLDAPVEEGLIAGLPVFDKNRDQFTTPMMCAAMAQAANCIRDLHRRLVDAEKDAETAISEFKRLVNHLRATVTAAEAPFLEAEKDTAIDAARAAEGGKNG